MCVPRESPYYCRVREEYIYIFYFHKQIKYWNITNAESLRGRSKRDTSGSTPIVYQYHYSSNPTFGTLRNLTAQVEFLATVASLNSGGMTEEESEAVSFKTDPRIPSVPLNVQITVFGSAAHINWQPPLYPNGYIETYEINIIGNDPRLTRAVQKTVRKDRRSREVYISDFFEPYTYYDVQVAARNRQGKGRPWVREKFTVSAPDSKSYFQKNITNLIFAGNNTSYSTFITKGNVRLFNFIDVYSVPYCSQMGKRLV